MQGGNKMAGNGGGIGGFLYIALAVAFGIVIVGVAA